MQTVAPYLLYEEAAAAIARKSSPSPTASSTCVTTPESSVKRSRFSSPKASPCQAFAQGLLDVRPEEWGATRAAG